MELDRYFHCKNCLKNEPHKSSLFDAGVKDGMFYVVCKNCGLIVVKFETTPESLLHLAGAGCFVCEGEVKEKISPNLKRCRCGNQTLNQDGWCETCKRQRQTFY